MEDPFLEIEPTTRIEHEAVGRVVRIGRVEAVQDAHAHVGLVVAVGVLQEDQIGRHGHVHAAVPEFESGRVVQMVGEGRTLVGLAVTVGVFQDEQLVVHLLLRLPVRIAGPGGHPESTLGIERHLHGVDHLGEHLFAGEEAHLQSLGDRHLADRFLATQEDMLAVRAGARFVRLHRDERRRIAVVEGQVASLCHGPHALVAVGGHLVEHFQFAHHHFAVGLAVDEFQKRPAAVTRVAVGRAIAVEPIKALVDHGIAQLAELVATHLGRPLREERLGDRLGHEPIAGFLQMDAVHRERLLG